MSYDYAGNMNTSKNVNLFDLLEEEGFLQNPREEDDDAEDEDEESESEGEEDDENEEDDEI